LILSFTVKLIEQECCSCYAGAKFGIGTTLLFAKRVTVECLCAAEMGCRAQYRIIPVDFIVLSMIIGAYGVYFVRSKARVVC